MNTPMSARLFGVFRHYDEWEKSGPDVVKLMERHTLIPVCPEQVGDMMTPRPSSRRRGIQMMNWKNEDVVAYHERGAEQALKLVRLYHREYATLKERSSPRGKGHVCDGTFTDTLVPGDSVTTALLTEHGIGVIGESRASQILGNNKKGSSDELEEK